MRRGPKARADTLEVGDDPADLGDVLSMWGIGFPPDIPDTPPDDWFDSP